MLKVFEEFREKLDEVMLKSMGKRTVLYGYDRTGQFLEWYADYYHSIKMDFIITTDWTPGIPRNFPLFSDTLFDFDYKDVKDAVVWLAIPESKDIQERLEGKGYMKGKTYFSFLDAVYGKDYKFYDDNRVEDVFYKKKTGKRDVQLLEWLEYKYDCNFLQTIFNNNFEGKGADGHVSYVVTTQKEIFPILDRCHCKPHKEDGIFDFGCGKGGALVSFLDYGFERVGGVEYEKKIFDIMISNFEKLGLNTEDGTISCIHGDAVDVKEELDKYTWFYYFEPFKGPILIQTINNIIESLKRVPRKIYIIMLNPRYSEEIVRSGFFVLTNQFCTATRQKVVDIFVSKKEYEQNIV